VSSSAGDGSQLRAVDRADTDAAVMLFTSGTAGDPKVAVLSHRNLISNLRQMLAVPSALLRHDDIGLAAVPFFHVFGLNVVLGLTIATGAGLVCEERFERQEALGLVKEREVTVVAGAPPMFADWARMADDDSGQPGNPFEHVRLAVSGAAALEPETAVRFAARFGLPLWQGYGLTEASPVVTTSVGTPAPKPGSVGRPLPGVEVRLVDGSGGPQDGDDDVLDDDVLTDDPGEILVRGSNIFHGYWRDEEATAEVLDDSGWLHTGDVGVLDDSGELHIVDRLKDIIIVSGFNVIPAEVESVVKSVPGVKDAVVVPGKNDRSGESVEAVVVADRGSGVTEADILTAARKHLAHYKIPKTIRFVDSLPVGLAGKSLRRLARDGTTDVPER
jgi:long-chain acyl-CoA synthetase